MSAYPTYRRPHATVTINPSSLRGIKTGRIITFSGASCSGKTTITEALGNAEGYCTIGKITTRESRNKISKELCVDSDVVEAIKQGSDFLYWMAYDGAYYVLPAQAVVECLAKDLTVLIDAPTIAALGLKEHLPDRVTTVFIDVPDPEITLAARLKKRGASDVTIKKRITDLPYVYASKDKFEIVILNPDAPNNQPLPAIRALHSLLEENKPLVRLGK